MKSRKNILVTGGAGFIGSNLSRALLEEGHRVDCVDNLITGYSESIAALKSNKRFRFIKMDITSPEFPTICGQNRYDEIYHLACPTGVPNIKILGEEMMQTCSIGTNQVLRLALMHNAKLVYTSSAEVYGDPKVFPQAEDYHGNVNPVGARSAYEEGKRFSEALAALYVSKYKLDARVVRLFNVFGPGMSLNDQRVIPQFISKIKQGKKITIFGDGSQNRTLLYVDDLVDGLRLTLRKGQRGEVYNLGGTTQLTMIELYEMMQSLIGRKIEVDFQPHFIEDHAGRQPSTGKITALGWKPKVSVQEGLMRMLAQHNLALPARRVVLEKSADTAESQLSLAGAGAA